MSLADHLASAPSNLRDRLQEVVLQDLQGPAGGPDEIVDEPSVRGRYLVGMLAPKGQTALPEESDELALGGADGEDGTTEARASKATASMFPSSIGLTFAVAAEATSLRVTARWGHYERRHGEDPAFRNRDGTFRLVWYRVPVEATSEPIALAPGRMADWSPCPDQPGVTVQGLIRKRDNQWIITLFLVNGEEEPKARKDTAWVFQPELVVESADGAAVFSKRPLPMAGDDPEELALVMLYRQRVEFAVGHGIAVEADLAEGCCDHAVRLRTCVMPEYEVPPTTGPSAEQFPVLENLLLDMKRLSNVADGSFADCLEPLAQAYEKWIEGLVERVEKREPDLVPHIDSARLAIEECHRTLELIRLGIALLDANPLASRAFRFANQAMYLQRVHSLYAAAVRRGESVDMAAFDVPANHTWRAFQLAFILLNLPGLTDLKHQDRIGGISAGADLLWFPTGGGKTEAYLGLAAYAMAVRRLQGELGGRSGHAGVAVLMRYTLRLLTLQQFQRAAALLCACELIRQEDPATWGDETFRLGLWVGRRTTPNWTADAEEAVKQIRNSAGTGGEGSPYQLTNCPWCGTPIAGGIDIKVEKPQQGRGRTFTYCGDELGECPFSRRQSPDEGLPVLVVDEEIYRRLPTLLIATVDKFAQMPWNGRTGMLFGQVDGFCERHGYRSPDVEDAKRHPSGHGLFAARTVPMQPLRPPDLIIQDELHLISGPLGTLVGLYETAIDHLASWEVDGVRVRPKVLASTATIRRAKQQVHGLFLRNVRVFPSQGLEASDNFFSREIVPDAENPGRRYLGICAAGTRHKAALIRTYLALLAGAEDLFEQNGVMADPWMTLVGYFNSLRELGGMRRAVDDTISTRLRTMTQRGFARRQISPWSVEELTSRKSATDIPQILDRLEHVFDPRAASVAGKGRKAGTSPIDVLLATNMVSVGVDVRRLGLMVVGGQPKMTAEYIQATSRIGRHFPGLVCTVYNWARPRDLSHYERFAHYHATFYQHVEALSVTPFSARALDRGLSALLVSLVRLAGPEFNANDGAGQVERDHAHVQAALQIIAARATNVAGNDSATLVQQTLASLRDKWLARKAQASVGAHLGYQEKNDGVTVGLLSHAGLGRWHDFTCLNSLRDVEPSVNLILRENGSGTEGAPPWRFDVGENASSDQSGDGSEEGTE